VSADRLRKAAAKIRETADGLTSWYEIGDDLGWAGNAEAQIALWSPTVARAVADWLDREAHDEDAGLRSKFVSEAYVLAFTVLGGTP
jgi:hypothetical protein